MTERALIHVAGPQGAGKTTFIEAVLEAGGLILAVRCVRDVNKDRNAAVPAAHGTSNR